MIKSVVSDMQPGDGRLHGIYRGCVEDNNPRDADNVPYKDGRIRVRVIGVHSSYVDDSEKRTDGIPVEDLPLAQPAMPIIGGGISGFGMWSVPEQGSFVFLFFENGHPLQPRYFAVAPGIQPNPTLDTNAKTGFKDPNRITNYNRDMWQLGAKGDTEGYPYSRSGESDMHRLARGRKDGTALNHKNSNLQKTSVASHWVKDEDDGWDQDQDKTVKAEVVDSWDSQYADVPYNNRKSKAGKWMEPMSDGGVYPNNMVIATHGGVLVEIDSTGGNKRFHIYHPTNSYLEIQKDGTMVIRNAKDRYDISMGKSRTYVGNDRHITVKGDNVERIEKDEFVEILGKKKDHISKDKEEIVGMPEWATGSKYRIGSVVVNNGKTYRVKSDGLGEHIASSENEPGIYGKDKASGWGKWWEEVAKPKGGNPDLRRGNYDIKIRGNKTEIIGGKIEDDPQYNIEIGEMWKLDNTSKYYMQRAFGNKTETLHKDYTLVVGTEGRGGVESGDVETDAEGINSVGTFNIDVKRDLDIEIGKSGATEEPITYGTMNIMVRGVGKNAEIYTSEEAGDDEIRWNIKAKEIHLN